MMPISTDENRISHIIFLHGPSSSGKSTIAQTLQARLPQPFWHISIDHLRDSGVLPSARYKSGEFDWTADRNAFFNGFHNAIAAFANAGNALILEHILDEDDWLADLQRSLKRHDVMFVGVYCDLPEMIAREAARGDRPIGSAEADFNRVHFGKRYDLKVQSEQGVDYNVDQIIDFWRRPVRRSDFAR
ncbi:MAG: AAA family ATPase [Pseudomonadota bacterium]